MGNPNGRNIIRIFLIKFGRLKYLAYICKVKSKNILTMKTTPRVELKRLNELNGDDGFYGTYINLQY